MQQMLSDTWKWQLKIIVCALISRTTDRPSLPTIINYIAVLVVQDGTLLTLIYLSSAV